MILFSLLLSAGLDLSLPEFEPDDVSGNYIVSEYDVSGDEFVAQEVPATDLPWSAVLRTEATAESQDVVDAINSLNDDNNANWNTFLSAYFNYLISEPVNPPNFWINQVGDLIFSVSSSYKSAYIPVLKGVSYHLYDFADISAVNNFYRLVVVDDIVNPTRVTNFIKWNDSETPSYVDITPLQDGYLFVLINKSSPFYFKAVTPNVSTLSEVRSLGNTVSVFQDSVNIKLRAVLFVCLMSFLYPLVISSFKNFFGGGKNV